MDKTPQEVQQMEETARAQASKLLPCPGCGCSGEPVLCAPAQGSAAWWDEPGVYVGCGECGYYLALLPSARRYVWQPDYVLEADGQLKPVIR